jgi:hypothetical protein
MEKLMMSSWMNMNLNKPSVDVDFKIFFCCNIIRAHRRLLETLIDYWEPEANAFMIRGKSIKIETKYIYFLTGLPCQGDVVNLKGKRSIGLTINEYIVLYCSSEKEKFGSQLLIRQIDNLGLKIIVLMTTPIFRYASLHQASRTVMYYSRECLRPILYDWSTTLLTCMKA